MVYEVAHFPFSFFLKKNLRDELFFFCWEQTREKKKSFYFTFNSPHFSATVTHFRSSSFLSYFHKGVITYFCTRGRSGVKLPEWIQEGHHRRKKKNKMRLLYSCFPPLMWKSLHYNFFISPRNLYEYMVIFSTFYFFLPQSSTFSFSPFFTKCNTLLGKIT